MIYQFSQPVDDLEAVHKRPPAPAMGQSDKPQTSVVFRRPTVQAPVQKPIEPAPQKTPDLSSASTQPAEPELPRDNPPAVVSIPPTDPMFSLESALQLRDHLAMGQSCLADLKIVMKRHLPNGDEKDRLIEKLMPVCTVRSAFEGIENTFYQNRKKALMTYYRLNNPLWLAYLKTLGTRLVDVRKLSPSKEKPKDMISLAQNALSLKNLDLATQKIQKLPPEIRADFNDFMGLANTYLAAQKEVESLILSFGRKGE